MTLVWGCHLPGFFMHLKNFGVMHEFLFPPLEGITASRETGNFNQGTIWKRNLLARAEGRGGQSGQFRCCCVLLALQRRWAALGSVFPGKLRCCRCPASAGDIQSSFLEFRLGSWTGHHSSAPSCAPQAQSHPQHGREPGKAGGWLGGLFKSKVVWK